MDLNLQITETTKHIENAFSVCSQCKKNLILTNRTFENVSEEENEQLKSISLIQLILQNDQNDWKFLEEYNQMNQAFAQLELGISLPLCISCSLKLINKVKIQKLIIESGISFFHDLQNEFNGQQIEEIILKAKDEQSQDVPNACNQTKSVHKNFPQKQLNFDTSSDFFSNNTLSDIFPENRIEHLSLSMSSAFHIAVDRHYITINDARIGFYKYSKNSNEENNIGLHFLMRLLWCFIVTFNIEPDGFSLTPDGVFKTNDNNILLLQIPKTSAETNYFNQAIDFLFKLSQKLFTSENLIKVCSVAPFEINSEKKIIENTSYKYSPKSLESWSTAMKYLLFDLKYLQTRACSAFLSK